jgi:putative ABC transport system permease protein
MKLHEMVVYALRSLQNRSLRSWLTILGIIIGITSMVMLVGMVQGLKDDVENQLKLFGPNTIIIIPTDVNKVATSGGLSMAPSSGKLYETDYERVKRVASIDTISKVIMGRMNAQYKDSSISTSVYGVEADNYQSSSQTIQVDTGRFLTSAERGSIVLGADVAQTGFKKAVELGSVVTIAGKPFRVAGILKKSGSSVGGTDSTIFMPIDDARALLGDSLAPNELSAIRIVVKEGADADEAAAEIEDIMLSSHRVNEDNKDFSLVTAAYINSQVNQTTSLLSLFLGAIAGISLAVGGIGIANTMFMSILERRREIGLLKAVGMTENGILGLFVLESSLIGIGGGIIGIIIGAILLYIASLLSFPAALPAYVVMIALVFSAAVGILSGFIPARQAAKLNPVEALRYE